jgi:hypothetical protein
MAGHQAAGEAGGFPQHTQNPPPHTPAATLAPLSAEQLAALQRLRAPFAAEQVSSRPEITCPACADGKHGRCAEHDKTVCPVCGSYVTTAHIDLDYVGHAEITGRLLDVDPLYSWEPMARTARDLPLLDEYNGLWMTLTVCGVTRYGYGDASRRGMNSTSVKEIIGNALRNAGMRFGMGLELWKPGARAAVEPSEAAKICERLDEKAVWNTPRALEEMRRRARKAGVLGHVVESAGWRTIGEVIQDRLAMLAEPTARDARAEGPREVTAADALAAKVDAGWGNVMACEQTLAEARHRHLADTPHPGDAQRRSFAQVLGERIAQLREERSGQDRHPDAEVA